MVLCNTYSLIVTVGVLRAVASALVSPLQLRNTPAQFEEFLSELVHDVPVSSSLSADRACGFHVKYTTDVTVWSNPGRIGSLILVYSVPPSHYIDTGELEESIRGQESIRLLYIDRPPDPELVEQSAHPHVFSVEIILKSSSSTPFTVEHQFPARRRYHRALANKEFGPFSGLLTSFNAVFSAMKLRSEEIPYCGSIRPVAVIFAKRYDAKPDSPSHREYYLVSPSGVAYDKSKLKYNNSFPLEWLYSFSGTVYQGLNSNDCQLLSSSVCMSGSSTNGYIPAAGHTWFPIVLILTAIGQFACFVKIVVHLLLE